MKTTVQTYVDMINEIGKDKFKARLKELKKSADEFIKEAGYSETVRCNERILAHTLLDYYADISRLKDFHEIELIRTEKIFAYTIAWIIKRKPLQFINTNEKDIYVNERFAAYLMINECLHCGEKNIAPSDQDDLNEYIDLIFYYLKYRECNPQVLELAMESFKMGTKVVKPIPKGTCELFAQDSQS